MLRVRLNALQLIPGGTGAGETYVRRVAPALLETGGNLELTVFAGNEGHASLAREPWAGEATLVRVPVSSQSRPLRALAEQTLLPRAARRARLDLLHNTLSTAPAFPGLPQVATTHAVTYKR